MKCISISKDSSQQQTFNISSAYLFLNSNRQFYYFSNNEVGLIYLLIFNDIEKATYYVKEAAFGEFQYGQNNLGLLNQFYFNDIQNANYMYTKSSNKKFPLSFYNLGYLEEKNGNVDESIKYYISASESEDEQMIFQKQNFSQTQLTISKTFVICLTNLKLTDYFLSQSDNETAKKYFKKAFSKLKMNENNSSRYEYNMNKLKESLPYLKSIILNFPPFNLINQTNLDHEIIEKLTELQKDEMKHPKNDKKNNHWIDVGRHIEKEKIKKLKMKGNIFSDEEENLLEEEEEINDDDVIKALKHFIFNNPDELFEFVIKNDDLKNALINSIREIIDIMNAVLYTPPYPILFGKINISKQQHKIITEQKKKYVEINELFYEGFGFQI